MSHEFPVAKVVVTDDTLTLRGVALANAELITAGRPASLVAGGVTYSIAKTVKVKVGAEVFYMPLFGPIT